MRLKSLVLLLLALGVLLTPIAQARPADVLHQVQIIYVVPSDTTPRDPATITASSRVMNGWFAELAGGLSFQLNPRVVVLSIDKTRAEMNAGPNDAFIQIAIELQVRGYAEPNVVYGVYYEGSLSANVCGRGATLTNGVHLAVTFLESGCLSQSLLPRAGASYPAASPGFVEQTTAHELVHAFGFFFCGGATGHVPEENDLMSSKEGVIATANVILDSGHDSYFGEHVPTGCPNLQDNLVSGDYLPLHLTISGSGVVEASYQEGSRFCSTSPCNVTPSRGELVTLTATPSPNNHFVGWSGACSGPGVCTFAMDQARDVTATFVSAPSPPPTYTLRVTVLGNGKGKVRFPGSSCQKGVCTLRKQAAGLKVRLSAAPDLRNSLFGGWSGACTGKKISCVVTMTGDKTARATFTLRERVRP